MKTGELMDNDPEGRFTDSFLDLFNDAASVSVPYLTGRLSRMVKIWRKVVAYWK